MSAHSTTAVSRALGDNSPAEQTTGPATKLTQPGTRVGLTVLLNKCIISKKKKSHSSCSTTITPVSSHFDEPLQPFVSFPRNRYQALCQRASSQGWFPRCDMDEVDREHGEFLEERRNQTSNKPRADVMLLHLSQGWWLLGFCCRMLLGQLGSAHSSVNPMPSSSCSCQLTGLRQGTFPHQ